MIPGELIPQPGSLEINTGRMRATIRVSNRADRPVQVGSHAHFMEVNCELHFDRAAAYGMRLDIPAGTAVRFEPGMERSVDLVAFSGERRMHGMRGLTEGALDDPALRAAALARAQK